MKYSTVELNNLSDNNAQHICLNDLLDIVVIKEDNTLIVKVLDLPNTSYEVRAEVIDFNEYKKLLEVKE